MNNTNINRQIVETADLPNLVDGLKASGKYLLGMVANDERSINSKFNILYFFGGGNSIEEYSVFTDDKFPAVSRICPAAKMYEREINDLFGLKPEGHPDLRPLMLYPENWDYSVHPLRKDYGGFFSAIKKYGENKK